MLVRDFKLTVRARVRRDPAFAKALLKEVDALQVQGESEITTAILRDYLEAGATR